MDVPLNGPCRGSPVHFSSSCPSVNEGGSIACQPLGMAIAPPKILLSNGSTQDWLS